MEVIMVKTTMRILVLTYLLVPSVSILYAMNNNSNPNPNSENTAYGYEKIKNTINQTKIVLAEELERVRNVLQFSSRAKPQNDVDPANEDQTINDDQAEEIQPVENNSIDLNENELQIETENEPLDVKNNILVVNDDERDEDDSIENWGGGENDSDKEERTYHHEGETYTFSDFDYVRDFSQKEFVNACQSDIFSKDFLWIGEIDNRVFQDLQSTGQLQEMILASKIGVRVSKPVMSNRNNETIEKKSNNNLSTSNLDVYNQEHEQQPRLQTRECPVCTEDAPEHEFITLECGHQSYCKGCLADFLKRGLKEKNSQQWKCPIQECTRQMSLSDIISISNDQMIQLTELSALPRDYTREEISTLVKNGAFLQEKPLMLECNELLEREELKLDKNIIFCPIDYCKGYFKKNTTLLDAIQNVPRNVKCTLCKNEYCNQCLKSHDMQTSCKDHEIFLSMTHQEKEEKNEEWLKENTKPCPECQCIIQRDGGCQHITCKQCTHQFCWICMDDWTPNRRCEPYKCRLQKKCPRCSHGVNKNGESNQTRCSRQQCGHQFCWTCMDVWNGQCSENKCWR